MSLMNAELEFLPYYQPVWKGGYPNSAQTLVPSLGTFYDGQRLPDLLVTALYKLDLKTGALVGKVKLIFQPDGPSEARLSFRRIPSKDNYVFSIYQFGVLMDAVYGEGVTNSRSIKGEMKAGVSGKGLDTGIGVEAQTGDTRPGLITSIHATFDGMLTGKEGLLEVWGDVTGSARMHRQ